MHYVASPKKENPPLLPAPLGHLTAQAGGAFAPLIHPPIPVETHPPEDSSPFSLKWARSQPNHKATEDSKRLPKGKPQGKGFEDFFF
jgi:hypothetical protein